MNFFQKLTRTISSPRFGSYKGQGGDEKDALSRYLWNIALCESLYPALHLIEVSYRNATHCAISETPIGMNWVETEVPFLYELELKRIREAKNNLRKRGKAVTESYLVSELSFGFWNSLLDARYDQLWHRIIREVFPHAPNAQRTRKNLSGMMSGVRNLRNAALHHHSIWHWSDLPQKHATLLTLLGWICTSSAAVVTVVDRFPAVHRAGAANFACGAELISG